MSLKSILAFCICTTLSYTTMAASSNLDESIAEVGHRWAKINYQTPDTEKEAAFNSLIVQVEQVSQSFPGKAEPLIWQAIVLSSAAKVEGGLGGLGKAKNARDLLLTAERISPAALNGSVYNSLGSLYSKVPGWPIGFGDKKKAKEYFDKALAINPNGIDPNYFYGDLLADQGEYARAVDFLRRALGAPPRPGREDADIGRRQEVSRLLESIKSKHGDELASK